MKQALLAALVAATVTFIATGPAFASAAVGQAAPAFSLKDTHGKAVSLADFKGKTVVLEWNNPECPFVKKHYDTSNMQGLQARAMKDGVVWLSINSTEPGHQDYKKPEVLNGWLKSAGSAPSAYLMDEDGKVGKLYGAKTTPHMYVINPQGTLVYAGGIDDKRSAKKEDVATAKNYVSAALDEMKAGKNITVSSAAPYGCSVKYKS